MSTDQTITTGLLSILDTNYPVGWPTVEFKPPSDEDAIWIRVRDFPNEPRELSIENDGAVMMQGFVQIEVHYRPATGSKGQGRYMRAIEIAEEFMLQYRKGTRAGPVGVYRRPWRSPAIEDPAESSVFVPITIPYRGIINQP